MNKGKERRGTQTSSFGISSRINHDSTTFYAGRLYENLPEDQKIEYLENKIEPQSLDRIFCKSSEKMDELPDKSIHLMVTSPPYNVGKDYDADLTLAEYMGLLRYVWGEVHRVLVPGGRVCINIANLGRKPYIPLHSFVIEDMISLGFLMRGEIIWNKSSSAGSSTAWGSWLSPTNPTLRDVHEYILVFSKGTFRRKKVSDRKGTISRDEFLEFTKSVWNFQSVSARKIGHPAPFPVELPYRMIQLYTFAGEVILDPFMGSGQTAIAAMKTDRHFIGYEIDETYIELAENRVSEYALESGRKV